MEINVNNVGAVGVVSDVPATELPLEAWTDARNVRFHEGVVEKFQGHTPVLDPPSIAPYFLMPVQTGSTYFWAYAGLTKVYATEASAHYNITRQTASVDVDYSASATDRWTGGVLGGVGV